MAVCNLSTDTRLIQQNGKNLLARYSFYSVLGAAQGPANRFKHIPAEPAFDNSADTLLMFRPGLP